MTRESRPKTDSILPPNLNVIGREDDVSGILRLLLDLSCKHSISGISIVGIPGVGKTTLAKSIYKKVEEEKLYDLVAWVCVSEDFNEQNILGEMFQHFKKDAAQKDSINVLLRDLSKELENKTLLLVLDDVWNQDPVKWDSFFSNYLSKIVKTTGNSIIITTRKKEVASSITENAFPMHNHIVQELSDDDCWLIIKDVILRTSTTSLIPSNLVAIGHDIAKQCGGLPLVASVIGGTLSRQIEEVKWLAIKSNNAWNSQDENKILSILKISFDHLCAPLKKCFSYCSIFPKDFIIEKDDLVHLWMAQSYLHQSKESSKTMEEIGKAYFGELLSNSLFQDVKEDGQGNIVSCKMHGVVRKLALFVSNGETLIWKTGSTPSMDENSNIRHLRVEFVGEKPPSIPRGVAQRLHSLFLDVEVVNSIASDLKSLRSLKLVGSNTEELSASLGELKHLKYLDISECRIKPLPKSFSKLYNLQTVRLLGSSRRCYLHKLPDGLTKMISLRHIYFPPPAGLPERRTNFWRFGYSSKFAIRGIGQLTSLQTLSLIFSVGKEKGYGIEALGCLSQLEGELSIGNLEHARSKSEATKANLKGKTKLFQLEFSWDLLSPREGNYNDEEVLEGLQPHSNLKSLTILNYFGEKFPAWIASRVNDSGSSFLLDNLVELYLITCMQCTCFPSLGLLPNLQLLYIEQMSKVRSMGHEFNHKKCSNQSMVESIILYPALRKLTIINMDCLEEGVEVGDKGEDLLVFPCLEELHIEHCNKLKTWSMNGLASLTSLTIEKCRQLIISEELGWLTSLKELSIGGWDMLWDEFPEINSIPLLHASLEKLKLYGWFGLESLPQQLQHLTALKELSIHKCFRLRALPEWLGNLSSLQKLRISECYELTSLPSVEAMRCLSNLKLFVLRCCYELEKRCTKENGSEWSKISHIPHIYFDGRRV